MLLLLVVRWIVMVVFAVFFLFLELLKLVDLDCLEQLLEDGHDVPVKFSGAFQVAAFPLLSNHLRQILESRR